MAKLFQGILGGISGKIGNVIGSSWKGIPVIKSRPLSVSNPRTSGQIEQRTKMLNVVVFAQLILSAVIKPLWDRFAQQQSGYNAFVSANIAFFDSWFASTPSSFIMSKGKMVAVVPTINALSNGDIYVDCEWNSALPDSLALATDEVYLVAVNETQQNVGVLSGSVARNSSAANIVLPTPAVTGDHVHVYIAFRRVDGTVVSDSGYATTIVIA